MPTPHRVMVRLSDELYTQLQARGRHGIPLAVIVRDAIQAYLAEQPEQPEQPEQLQQPTRAAPAATAALAARVEALAQQVQQLITRLDALDAPRQPQQPQEQPRAADTRTPAYDPTRYVLGRLCPQRHAYASTGMSLRRLRNHGCVECDRLEKRERRARTRQQG